MTYYDSHSIARRMTDEEQFERLLLGLPARVPWVIPGGVDVCPELYGELHTHSHWYDKRVDERELRLVSQLINMGAPLLGICRGHQLIAIAMGGTLYQDIHLDGATKNHYHGPVRITANSILAKIFPDGNGQRVGRWLSANSLHHQAVKDVPPGWVVSARSPDGIIEAIESPVHPQIISVQWHPEVTGQWEPMLNYLSQYIKGE